MNHKLTMGGAVVALLAVSAGAGAYHITGAQGAHGVYSAYNWVGQLNVELPPAVCDVLLRFAPPLYVAMCVQQLVIFASSLCEGEQGFDFDLDVSYPGFGGLCYMSAGTGAAPACATPGTINPLDMGRSNGRYPAYSGLGTCAAFPPASTPGNPNGLLPVPAGSPTNLVRITMCDQSTHSQTSPGPNPYASGLRPVCVGPNTTFSTQINGVECVQPARLQVDYDDVFAYEVADGHVGGYPTTVPPPFGLGTYAVGAGVRGTILTECASGLPWWQ